MIDDRSQNQNPSTQASYSPDYPRPVNWIVSWRYNDVEHNDGFEFHHVALARQLELDSFDIKATIHQVTHENR